MAAKSRALSCREAERIVRPMRKSGRATVVSGEQRTEVAKAMVNSQKPIFRFRRRVIPSASAAAPSRNSRNQPGKNSSICWEPVVCTWVNSSMLSRISSPARQGSAGILRLFRLNHSPMPMSTRFIRPMRAYCR